MDRALMRTAEKGEGLEVTASFLRSNADHKWRALSFERESGIGRDRLWRGWDIEICFQWVEVELSGAMISRRLRNSELGDAHDAAESF